MPTLTGEQLDALKSAPLGNLPNRLSIAFAFANVKQSAAAESLGMSPSDMSKLVRGAYQTLDIVKARKLANYFGCAIEDLFPPRSEHQAVPA